MAKSKPLIELKDVFVFLSGAAFTGLIVLGFRAQPNPLPIGPQPAPVAAPTEGNPGGTMPGGGMGEPAPAVSESELKTAEAIVAKNPNNIQAMTDLANLYFDAKRYEDSITWYQKILDKNPRDVNISTDLGTAYWYTNRPDEALAQFDRSLQIDPNHAQTLYNVGIVRLHGKNDIPGAVTAWEKLIATNPNYPQAQKLKERITSLNQMK